MTDPLTSNQEVHEPCCPPESRCVICWDDDDAVIKALVADRDRWERNFASERVNVEALRVEKSNLASRLRMIEQESQGKPTGTCPGTTRGNLGVNSPALRLLPSAWMKVHRVPSTPDQAPGELDIECYAGDDPPDNEPGWIPLYRRAADETSAVLDDLKLCQHQWQYFSDGRGWISRSCIVCHKLEYPPNEPKEDLMPPDTLEAERERLRAALRDISTDEFTADFIEGEAETAWQNDYWRVVNIAREALADANTVPDSRPEQSK